jgi:hypothetical protein
MESGELRFWQKVKRWLDGGQPYGENEQKSTAILCGASQELQPHVADTPAVDEEKHAGRLQLRLGERDGREARPSAQALFDSCAVVPLWGVAVGCKTCGFRAVYEIRETPFGKGRMLVRQQILDFRPLDALSQGGATHSNECPAASLEGMDFREIAQIGRQSHVVASSKRRIHRKRDRTMAREDD